MRRQHAPDKLALLGHYELLVFGGISAALGDERGDIRFLQEEFVEPGDLRKHLQVVMSWGVNARCKASGSCRFFWARLKSSRYRGSGRSHAARGLEKILQREGALLLGHLAGGMSGDVEEGSRALPET